MIREVEFTNFARTVRELLVDWQGKSIPLITIGPGSYLVNASLEYGSFDGHVLIGRYSSLAHRLKFIVGYNHDASGVATYPFQDVMYLEQRASEDGIVNHCYGTNHYQIIMGNDVWIGADVTILGGVRIGNGAIVGAGAIVAKDVPPYAVVVGNPAHVVKYRFSEETIDKLQEIKWWYWPEQRIKDNLELMKDPDEFVRQNIQWGIVDEEFGLAEQMRNLQGEGYKLYAFVADFDAPCPVWEKVLLQCLKSNLLEGKRLFLLGAINQEQHRKHVGEVQSILDGFDEDVSGGVVLLGDISKFLTEFVRNADVFITTREDISSQCVDLAAGHDVRIVSGLDYGIF